MAQGIHRVTAVGSIAFLVIHITVKLALDHTVLIAALIPFSLGVKGSAGLIGLGSLAGLLMIFVGITGALRNQFASPRPSPPAGARCTCWPTRPGARRWSTACSRAARRSRSS